MLNVTLQDIISHIRNLSSSQKILLSDVHLPKYY